MLFFGKKSAPASESPAPESTLVESPDSYPPAPGFSFAQSRRLQQKTRALKRQLRTASRAIQRSRIPVSRPVVEPPPVVAPIPAVIASPAPQLNAADVGEWVAKAPVLVELQYEVLDLRHEIEALKQQLAALHTKVTEQPVELKTSQLSIIDAAGRSIAGISSEGVVSCRMIEMHPGKS